MSLQQIAAADVAGWDSLQAIASSFEKRGLKPRPKLGADNEFVLQLSDDEFIVLVEAGPGESATDYKPEDVDRRHTNLVATNDFETFTFLTRVRTFGQQHGKIKHRKLEFERKEIASKRGEKRTILEKLNEIEFGSSAVIFNDLYDTRKIVNEFYEKFEELRTDLIQEVTGIPDDRGDAKRRYVQVTLDRMIFLSFIQEKRLLDRKLNYLHEKHTAVATAGSDVYEEFYRPLFFELLAEGKRDGEFGKLPYLDGGLFSKNPIEEEFPSAKLGGSVEETNALFGRILEFLSGWNWNVDERLDIVDPMNLSPAILGHIFEQTVNQKEMGAYYTPEEITGFMARRTIHPYLLDQLNDAVGAAYGDIDEIFGLAQPSGSSRSEAVADGGTYTPQAPTENVTKDHVETLYFDVLRDIRVLDPAVGSGAFLLAAQDVLLDVSLQCLEYFQQVDTERMSWKLDNRTREELGRIEERDSSTSLYAKRQIVLENLYGVDIDDGAVEICKLRLWLSMVADIQDDPNVVDPLPNIDFNIRQGNSLIGFTELIEVNDDGTASLVNYGGGVGESVAEMYEDVIEAVERHRNAESGAEAAKARKEAEALIESHSETLNEKVLGQFHDAGLEDVTIAEVEDYSPFHWMLEFSTVYQDEDDEGEVGFDVVIGNPPWDVLTPNRDDYFSKFDEIFRMRMPEDKENTMERLLSTPSIETGWEEYQVEMERRATYFNDGSQYTLQNPAVNGRGVGNENDLSMLFFERVFNLVHENGFLAQILPGVIFNGAAGKDLRLHALQQSEIRDIVGFENRGIFEGLHNQYNFGIITLRNGGSTDTVRGIFHQTSLDVLQRIDEESLQIPSRVLTEFSPNARIFPNVESQAEVDILDKLLKPPSVSEDIENSWYASLYAELHRAGDSDRLVEDESEGAYPVFEGKNVFQFNYDNTFLDDLVPISLWSVDENTAAERSAKERIREKNVRSRDEDVSLKKAIYSNFSDRAEFGHLNTRSQKGFVNDLLTEECDRPELSPEDVLLDSTEYRIVLREIARATDERTLIAGVIPRDAVAVHTLHTVRPYKINPQMEDICEYPMHSAYERVFTDEELFVALGLLNSTPFDYLMRTKVDSHIVKYKFEESQLPRLVDGDDWFHYISSRAARLNCYGEAFAEMRERLGGIEPATDKTERQTLQAEIDAAAFHAYGLDRNEMKFVLDDFHRVSNPRIMTEEYFDLVFEKYDVLAEDGPYP